MTGSLCSMSWSSFGADALCWGAVLCSLGYGWVWTTERGCSFR